MTTAWKQEAAHLRKALEKAAGAAEVAEKEAVCLRQALDGERRAVRALRRDMERQLKAAREAEVTKTNDLLQQLRNKQTLELAEALKNEREATIKSTTAELQRLHQAQETELRKEFLRKEEDLCKQLRDALSHNRLQDAISKTASASADNLTPAKQVTTSCPEMLALRALNKRLETRVQELEEAERRSADTVRSQYEEHAMREAEQEKMTRREAHLLLEKLKSRDRSIENLEKEITSLKGRLDETRNARDRFESEKPGESPRLGIKRPNTRNSGLPPEAMRARSSRMKDNSSNELNDEQPCCKNSKPLTSKTVVNGPKDDRRDFKSKIPDDQVIRNTTDTENKEDKEIHIDTNEKPCFYKESATNTDEEGLDSWTRAVGLETLYQVVIREHQDLQRAHQALLAKLKAEQRARLDLESPVKIREENPINLALAAQIQELTARQEELISENHDLREQNDLLEFRLLEMDSAPASLHFKTSASPSRSPESRGDREVDDVSDSGVLSLPTSEDISEADFHDLAMEPSSRDIKFKLAQLCLSIENVTDKVSIQQGLSLLRHYEVRLETALNTLSQDSLSVRSLTSPDSVISSETSKSQSRIIATVLPFTDLSQTNGKQKEDLPLKKLFKDVDCLQESGIFEESPEYCNRCTQTDCSSGKLETTGDLSLEIRKLKQIQERIEEQGSNKRLLRANANEANGLSAESKELVFYRDRVEMLENKLAILESSGDEQMKKMNLRLDREILLSAEIKHLKERCLMLEELNRKLEEEKCEFEEAENDTRLRCQKLEVKLSALGEKKSDLQVQLQQNARTMSNLRSCLAEEERKRIEARQHASRMENLVQHYEQRNFELEEKEIESRCRAQMLEKTIPALEVYNTWKVANALCQSAGKNCSSSDNDISSKMITSSSEIYQSCCDCGDDRPKSYKNQKNSKKTCLSHDIGDQGVADYHESLSTLNGSECNDQVDDYEDYLHDRIKKLELAIKCKEQLQQQSLSPDQKNSLMTKLQELKKTNCDLECRLKDLEMKEGYYKQTLQQADEMWANMESGYKEQLRELENKLEEKQNEIYEFEAMVRKLSCEKEMRQQLQERTCSLESEMKDFRFKIAEKECERRLLEKERLRLTEELEHTNEEFNYLKYVIEPSLRQQLEEHKKLSKELKCEIETLEKDKEQEIEDRLAEVSGLKRKMNKLSKELLENECTIGELREEVQTLEMAVIELREKLEDVNDKHEREVMKMAVEIDDKNREIQFLKENSTCEMKLPKSARQELEEAEQILKSYNPKNSSTSTSCDQKPPKRLRKHKVISPQSTLKKLNEKIRAGLLKDDKKLLKNSDSQHGVENLTDNYAKKTDLISTIPIDSLLVEMRDTTADLSDRSAIDLRTLLQDVEVQATKDVFVESGYKIPANEHSTSSSSSSAIELKGDKEPHVDAQSTESTPNSDSQMEKQFSEKFYVQSQTDSSLTESDEPFITPPQTPERKKRSETHRKNSTKDQYSFKKQSKSSSLTLSSSTQIVVCDECFSNKRDMSHCICCGRFVVDGSEIFVSRLTSFTLSDEIRPGQGFDNINGDNMALQGMKEEVSQNSEEDRDLVNKHKDDDDDDDDDDVDNKEKNDDDDDNFEDQNRKDSNSKDRDQGDDNERSSKDKSYEENNGEGRDEKDGGYNDNGGNQSDPQGSISNQTSGGVPEDEANNSKENAASESDKENSLEAADDVKSNVALQDMNEAYGNGITSTDEPSTSIKMDMETFYVLINPTMMTNHFLKNSIPDAIPIYKSRYNQSTVDHTTDFFDGGTLSWHSPIFPYSPFDDQSMKRCKDGNDFKSFEIANRFMKNDSTTNLPFSHDRKLMNDKVAENALYPLSTTPINNPLTSKSNNNQRQFSSCCGDTSQMFSIPSNSMHNLTEFDLNVCDRPNKTTKGVDLEKLIEMLINENSHTQNQDSSSSSLSNEDPRKYYVEEKKKSCLKYNESSFKDSLLCILAFDNKSNKTDLQKSDPRMLNMTNVDEMKGQMTSRSRRAMFKDSSHQDYAQTCSTQNSETGNYDEKLNVFNLKRLAKHDSESNVQKAIPKKNIKHDNKDILLGSENNINDNKEERKKPKYGDLIVDGSANMNEKKELHQSITNLKSAVDKTEISPNSASNVLLMALIKIVDGIYLKLFNEILIRNFKNDSILLESHEIFLKSCQKLLTSNLKKEILHQENYKNIEEIEKALSEVLKCFINSRSIEVVENIVSRFLLQLRKSYQNESTYFDFYVQNMNPIVFVANYMGSAEIIVVGLVARQITRLLKSAPVEKIDNILNSFLNQLHLLKPILVISDADYEKCDSEVEKMQELVLFFLEGISDISNVQDALELVEIYLEIIYNIKSQKVEENCSRKYVPEKKLSFYTNISSNSSSHASIINNSESEKIYIKGILLQNRNIDKITHDHHEDSNSLKKVCNTMINFKKLRKALSYTLKHVTDSTTADKVKRFVSSFKDACEQLLCDNLNTNQNLRPNLPELEGEIKCILQFIDHKFLEIMQNIDCEISRACLLVDLECMFDDHIRILSFLLSKLNLTNNSRPEETLSCSRLEDCDFTTLQNNTKVTFSLSEDKGERKLNCVKKKISSIQKDKTKINSKNHELEALSVKKRKVSNNNTRRLSVTSKVIPGSSKFDTDGLVVIGKSMNLEQIKYFSVGSNNSNESSAKQCAMESEKQNENNSQNDGSQNPDSNVFLDGNISTDKFMAEISRNDKEYPSKLGISPSFDLFCFIPEVLTTTQASDVQSVCQMPFSLKQCDFIDNPNLQLSKKVMNRSLEKLFHLNDHADLKSYLQCLLHDIDHFLEPEHRTKTHFIENSVQQDLSQFLPRTVLDIRKFITQCNSKASEEQEIDTLKNKLSQYISMYCNSDIRKHGTCQNELSNSLLNLPTLPSMSVDGIRVAYNIIGNRVLREDSSELLKQVQSKSSNPLFGKSAFFLQSSFHTIPCKDVNNSSCCFHDESIERKFKETNSLPFSDSTYLKNNDVIITKSFQNISVNIKDYFNHCKSTQNEFESFSSQHYDNIISSLSMNNQVAAIKSMKTIINVPQEYRNSQVYSVVEKIDHPKEENITEEKVDKIENMDKQIIVEEHVRIVRQILLSVVDHVLMADLIIETNTNENHENHVLMEDLIIETNTNEKLKDLCSLECHWPVIMKYHIESYPKKSEQLGECDIECSEPICMKYPLASDLKGEKKSVESMEDEEKKSSRLESFLFDCLNKMKHDKSLGNLKALMNSLIDYGCSPRNDDNLIGVDDEAAKTITESNEEPPEEEKMYCDVCPDYCPCCRFNKNNQSSKNFIKNLHDSLKSECDSLTGDDGNTTPGLTKSKNAEGLVDNNQSLEHPSKEDLLQQFMMKSAENLYEDHHLPNSDFPDHEKEQYENQESKNLDPSDLENTKQLETIKEEKDSDQLDDQILDSSPAKIHEDSEIDNIKVKNSLANIEMQQNDFQKHSDSSTNKHHLGSIDKEPSHEENIFEAQKRSDSSRDEVLVQIVETDPLDSRSNNEDTKKNQNSVDEQQNYEQLQEQKSETFIEKSQKVSDHAGKNGEHDKKHNKYADSSAKDVKEEFDTQEVETIKINEHSKSDKNDSGKTSKEIDKSHNTLKINSAGGEPACRHERNCPHRRMNKLPDLDTPCENDGDFEPPSVISLFSSLNILKSKIIMKDQIIQCLADQLIQMAQEGCLWKNDMFECISTHPSKRYVDFDCAMVADYLAGYVYEKPTKQPCVYIDMPDHPLNLTVEDFISFDAAKISWQSPPGCVRSGFDVYVNDELVERIRDPEGLATIISNLDTKFVNFITVVMLDREGIHCLMDTICISAVNSDKNTKISNYYHELEMEDKNSSSSSSEDVCDSNNKIEVSSKWINS